MKEWTKDAPICEGCNLQHHPMSHKCSFKIEKDADVVINAAGACLNLAMMDRLKEELCTGDEPSRYVSAPHQYAFLRRQTEVGGDWLILPECPCDMLILETSQKVGVIKNLEVPPL